jgi:hypothetical protein
VTLKQAIALLPRPWIDGVTKPTFAEWDTACAVIEAETTMPDEYIKVPRDLLIKADSYLSLLWYRPSTPHDTDLQIEIPRVIADLRRAYEGAKISA